MAYVALSRVRDLAGLSLVSFDPKSFKADDKVIEFYDKLENASASAIAFSSASSAS